MDWKNTDPRKDINKRADIVILRPGLSGFRSRTAGIGNVDTKTDWSIVTSFEDHRLINADDKWDSSWMWVPFIEVTKCGADIML
jgi:hypothetical protein